MEAELACHAPKAPAIVAAEKKIAMRLACLRLGYLLMRPEKLAAANLLH